MSELSWKQAAIEKLRNESANGFNHLFESKMACTLSLVSHVVIVDRQFGIQFESHSTHMHYVYCANNDWFLHKRTVIE